MKISFAFAIAVAAACVGCATPERSRALNDPRVPASATAQQVCSNCHGIDGNAPSPNFPRLAAQQPQYLVSQLKAFRSHNRSDPAGFEYMWGLSKYLTDAQIEGLAQYFSTQKAAPNPGRADPALVAKGKEIYDHGMPDRSLMACTACHGEGALGNGSFPRLAGQHSDYVMKQLNVFSRTEQRPEGAVMKPIAHLLEPSDMRAVALYVQSQAGP
jgi:cytochrome c553